MEAAKDELGRVILAGTMTKSCLPKEKVGKTSAWATFYTVPDLIALYHRIIFQLSTNSLLFSAHINSSSKNFFLLHLSDKERYSQQN